MTDKTLAGSSKERSLLKALHDIALYQGHYASDKNPTVRGLKKIAVDAIDAFHEVPTAPETEALPRCQCGKYPFGTPPNDSVRIEDIDGVHYWKRVCQLGQQNAQKCGGKCPRHGPYVLLGRKGPCPICEEIKQRGGWVAGKGYARDNDAPETLPIDPAHCQWSRKHTIAGVLHERGCEGSPCLCGGQQTLQPVARSNV